MDEHFQCPSLPQDYFLNEKMDCGYFGNLSDEILRRNPNLFSNNALVVKNKTIEHLQKFINLLEKIIHLPDYKNMILPRSHLASSPQISEKSHLGNGVFMGYDFHLTENGPKLIEINTNAGGPLLNVIVQERWQKYLVNANQSASKTFKLAQIGEESKNSIYSISTIANELCEMFKREHQICFGKEKLQRVVILDDLPHEQFLYPEFQLFKFMFEKNNIEAYILDPSQLIYDESKKNLIYENKRIDLIYNRVTDFYFKDERYRHIAHAFEDNAITLTPHPLNHALFADKHNLTVLSSRLKLESLGVSSDEQKLILSTIPTTIEVNKDQAEELWSNRKHLFFKPNLGYGSKGAYRGDKITKKVWSQILELEHDYIAQDLAPPGHIQDLKFDLRAYTYNAKILLFGVRFYNGQTTNFRTPGGGFGPLLIENIDFELSA